MNHDADKPSLRKGLANLFMSLCVPKKVEDDILGDLQEEFSHMLSLGSENKAKNWYFRQGIKTALLYLWSQRGDQMILLFALSIFALAVMLILALSVVMHVFYDAATLVTVILPAILLGIATTNGSSVKHALQISFMNDCNIPQQAYLTAIDFFRNTGNLAIMMGALVCAIQWLGYASMQTTKPAELLFAHTLTTSMLSPIYGLLFKILCFTGEKKVAFKYRARQ